MPGGVATDGSSRGPVCVSGGSGENARLENFLPPCVSGNLGMVFQTIVLRRASHLFDFCCFNCVMWAVSPLNTVLSFLHLYLLFHYNLLTVLNSYLVLEPSCSATAIFHTGAKILGRFDTISEFLAYFQRACAETAI